MNSSRHNPSAPADDQATRLRELTSRRRRHGLCIAVLSGKGGVGKSTVAVNAALCLAERGLRVVLVDLDMGLANADLLLGVRARYGLGHVVSGARTLEQVVCRGPGGIYFVAGVSGDHSLANLSEFDRQRLLVQLHKLRANADIAVLDLGAGLSRNVLSFAQSCEVAWVVTTPEPTSIADAYAVIKALHQERSGPGIQIVVNRADSRESALSVFGRLSGVAQKFLDFSIAYGGYVLHDSSVELAVRARCPVVIRYPGSNASACIAAIANEVVRGTTVAQRPGGWLHRVAGLFA